MQSQNGFTLSIIGGFQEPVGNFKNPYDKGYVSVNHQQEYKVRLGNNRSQKCQVSLKIDDNLVGNFIINPGSEIIIERPVNVNKKFQFVLTGTSEASLGKIMKNDLSNGLVEATFVPEMNKGIYIDNDSNPNSITKVKYFNLENKDQIYHEGGTILQNRSYQKFRETTPLNLDYSQETYLSVRLIGKVNDKIQPLSGKYNIDNIDSCPNYCCPLYSKCYCQRPMRIPPPQTNDPQAKPDPWFLGKNYFQNDYKSDIKN